MSKENLRVYMDDQPSSPPSYDFATSNQQSQPLSTQPLTGPLERMPIGAVNPVAIYMPNQTMSPSVNPSVGRKKMYLTCRDCNNQVNTKTITKYKCMAHCCCCLLCLTGIFCPFIFLPYCLFAPERVEHYCPKCNATVGTYFG